MVNVSQIKEHMDVIASDGKTVGKVDHLEGQDRIKLTKTDSPDGKHHLVPVRWIDHVDPARPSEQSRIRRTKELERRRLGGRRRQRRRRHRSPVASSSPAHAARINFSTAVSRTLRLPTSAIASSSAPSAVQVPEKPMPTS